MAKKQKSSFSEVSQMQDMSLEELQSRFYALAQNAENKNAQIKQPGAQPPLRNPNEPPASFANLDLGAGPESANDFENLSTEELAQKYLDPATLESRPEYADGSAPEKAIHKIIDGSTWERIKLSFGNKSPQEQVKYLEQEYGPGNVQLSKGGNIAIKNSKDNAWYRLDPEGSGQGTAWERAFETTRDVLADNADIATGLGLTVATAGLAAPLAAGLTGARAVGAGLAIAGQAGAVSGAGRVLMGRLSGTYEATPEQMLRDISTEAILSMAGEAFIPGVKFGAKQFGKMWQKAAPNLAKADPAVKSIVAKITGTLSGAGEEAADHWVNNASKVGTYMSQYGDDIEGALLANVDDTMNVARSIVNAKRNYGAEIYNKFAEEAGEDFAPWVGKIFTGSNVENPPLSLMKDGVLSYKDGKLSAKLSDDVASLFGEKETLKILDPVLNVVNSFNKARPKPGKEGARQYMVFKERLNDALAKAEAIATAPGRNDLQAFGQVRNLKNELLTAYGQKAVDIQKAPELAAKLAAVDKEYARVSTLTDEFEKAVRKGGELDRGPYQQLYQKVFAPNGATSKTAVVKSELNDIYKILGKYDSSIIETVDNIGARKAAVAGSPWLRPGQASNVQTTAGMLTGMLSKPIYGVSIFAGASPKINYRVARMASSGLDALNNFTKLPAVTRMQALKSPQAVAQFFKPILEIPGMEASIGQELGGMLTGAGVGNQNGQ